MWELIKYFLYLGVTGFGGPLMLIQQMRQHYAEEQKQISTDEFDQAFTLIKAMPGPIAFQMAVYLGNRFHKFGGALLAGCSLLLPSFLIMLLVGYFYKSLVGISFVNPILEGFLFSVSAVILFSLKTLVTSNYRYFVFLPLVLISTGLAWLQIMPEPFLILGSGLIVVLMKQHSHKKFLFSVAFLAVDWQQIYELFKICLFSGAFVFGTGLALIPVLQTNLVDVRQWLTLKEFTDAVIFGQMTPGPITITGTLLGYQISGLVGAFAATIGIFIMPFIHMTTWFPHAVRWLAKQKWISPFLIGATAAVVGAIAATLIKMNLESANKPLFWIIFLCNLVILLKWPKASIVALVLSSGLINLLVTLAAVNAI